MDLHLNGRTAVVTGASRGIGLAVAGALVREGARVVTGSREITPELRALAAEGDVLTVAVDLTAPEGPAELVAAATFAYGGLDILVNNVGAVRPRTDGFLAVTDDDWAATLSVNLLAPVRTTRAALPHLLERGAGSIVTVSSVNAFLPDPLVIDYSASKAALSNFCKSLSKQVGPRGVRVNTGLWLARDGVAATVAAATGGSADAVAERAAADAATGRFTRPDEVADLVVFLAGDRAANITGSDFVVDGGLVSTL
jgi:NAD(P)-dependent dehydrogenase (short-subunit alcohol dehydrogenase family)